MSRFILMDPPWPYDCAVGQGCLVRTDGSVHFEPMSTKELQTMELPAASDCVALVWVTFTALLDCVRMMSAHGFTFRGVHVVWLKIMPRGTATRWGPGNYTHGNIECVLWFDRGDTPHAPSMRRVNAPTAGFCVKPGFIFSDAEAICTTYDLGTPMEIFARCTSRPGWAYGAGEQKATYAGLGPDDIAAKSTEMKTLPVRKRMRIYRAISDYNTDCDRPIKAPSADFTALVLFAPNTAAELDMMHIASALAPSSVLLIEADCRNLLDIAAAGDRIPYLAYKCIFFYVYDSGDDSVNRFFLGFSPRMSRIRSIRKKLVKQTVDIHGVEDVQSCVIARLRDIFGPGARVGKITKCQSSR